MNLRALRYFASVADSRSFSKAADLLHIGQPALSRSIQQLEEELGVNLLRRSSRGVEVTPAGQTLRARSQPLLEQLDQLRDDVRAHADEVTGTVTVGLPSVAGQLLVPEAMRSLSRLYPGIKLHVVEGLSSETHDRLLGQTVQIGLMYDPSAHRDLVAEPLAEEKMYLVGRRDRIEALGPVRDLAAIENLPLILPRSPNSRRLLVERAFRDRGLMLNVVAELDGFATTYALLCDGFGFSLMTRAAALPGLNGEPALVATELGSENLSWRLSMVQHRAQRHRRAVQAAAHVVRSAIRRLVAGGRWTGISLLNGAAPPPRPEIQ